MAKKKDRGYRDYWVYKKDKNGNKVLYGRVAIPRGDGTYKEKTQRVKTKTEAREWARKEFEKVGLGFDDFGNADATPEPKKTMTFFELADWYKEKYCVPPIYNDGDKVKGMRTYEGKIGFIDRLSTHFGLYRLDAITLDVLESYKTKRLTGEILYFSKGQKKKRVAGIATTNKELGILQTMFKKAVRRDWMKKNPFDDCEDEPLIEKNKERTRIKILTGAGVELMNDQIADKLIAAAPQVKRQKLLPEVLTVLRWTGARPSEIFPFGAYNNKATGKGDGVPREPLIWKNILEFDFKAVRLVEYKGKARIERVVPAVPELQRCLRALHAKRPLAKPTDLVFPFKGIKRSWATVCEKAGITAGRTGVVSRDFRAYYNNKLIEWKVPDVLRRMIIGHESVATNEIYTAITPEFINAFTAEYVSDAVN